MTVHYYADRVVQLRIFRHETNYVVLSVRFAIRRMMTELPTQILKKKN